MTHLDEGSIHAWLDGALDGRNASDVEAHVATCATCSALVAEARGFKAGASRILTALDDVPAGVTPKRAPSTAPAIRQWRAAPWVTGIAATLVLAIGIRAYTREPAAVVVAERSAARLDSVAPARAKQATPAAPPTARVLSAAATREAREPAAPAEAISTAGAGASTELGSGRMAKRVAAAVADVSPDAKKPAADQALAAAPVAFKSELGVGANATPSDARELAGCYPVERLARGRLVDAAADAAGKVAAPASPERFRLDEASSKAPPGPPTMVLLDTSRHSRGGFVARSAATREAIGAWHRIDGDSVRVDLLVRGRYTIAASKRVGCPAP